MEDQWSAVQKFTCLHCRCCGECSPWGIYTGLLKYEKGRTKLNECFDNRAQKSEGMNGDADTYKLFRFFFPCEGGALARLLPSCVLNEAGATSASSPDVCCASSICISGESDEITMRCMRALTSCLDT
jgi:hypothetical protein